MVTTAPHKRIAPQAERAFDRRLGEMLIDNGTFTEQEIKSLLEKEREHGERFSDIALRLGLVSELDIRRALARQCEISTVLPDTATFSRQLVAAFYPNSKRTEALRGLRSELLLRWFTRNQCTLAIGETHRHQGAAALAANLAWLFAQLGQRTLLIDANLRHPQQQTLFKLSSRIGLSEFLNGQCTVDETLHPVPGLAALSVMFAGKPPANPQELLNLESFRHLLEALHKEFDAILLTGAPMLDYADMQAIAACAGGCVITAQRHRTKIADLKSAKSYLVPTAATLVGVVIED